MFSFSKLLALIGIIGAVWYGFRLLNRLQEARADRAAVERRRDSAREAARGADKADDGAHDGGKTVDLVRDEETGTYVPRDPTDRRS